jgi:hypothetical protein
VVEVPVTEYVVFDVGETVTVPIPAPVFQLYVLAPAAISVALLPRQIELLPVIETDGKAITAIVFAPIPLQFTEFVPMTEYTAVAVGEIEIVLPEELLYQV